MRIEGAGLTREMRLGGWRGTAVVWECAHWRKRRDDAGLLLDVGFETPGRPSYVRGAGRRTSLAMFPRRRDRAGDMACRGASGNRKGRRHERQREGILRFPTCGGLSRSLAPHARRIPRERRRAGLSPLRQPGAESLAGSGLLGGGAQSGHNGGDRQTRIRTKTGNGVGAFARPAKPYLYACLNFSEVRAAR